MTSPEEAGAAHILHNVEPTKSAVSYVNDPAETALWGQVLLNLDTNSCNMELSTAGLGCQMLANHHQQLSFNMLADRETNFHDSISEGEAVDIIQKPDHFVFGSDVDRDRSHHHAQLMLQQIHDQQADQHAVTWDEAVQFDGHIHHSLYEDQPHVLDNHSMHIISELRMQRHSKSNYCTPGVEGRFSSSPNTAAASHSPDQFQNCGHSVNLLSSSTSSYTDLLLGHESPVTMMGNPTIPMMIDDDISAHPYYVDSQPVNSIIKSQSDIDQIQGNSSATFTVDHNAVAGRSSMRYIDESSPSCTTSTSSNNSAGFQALVHTNQKLATTGAGSMTMKKHRVGHGVNVTEVTNMGTASSASNASKIPRKEKIGDKIATLQQLVSPFGKTDTASVLLEAIGYIKFLQDQIQALSSPYMQQTVHTSTGMAKLQRNMAEGMRGPIWSAHQGIQNLDLLRNTMPNRTLATAGGSNYNGPDTSMILSSANVDNQAGLVEQNQCQAGSNGTSSNNSRVQDLRSRGLCLVPVSSTMQVANIKLADYWGTAA